MSKKLNKAFKHKIASSSDTFLLVCTATFPKRRINSRPCQVLGSTISLKSKVLIKVTSLS